MRDDIINIIAAISGGTIVPILFGAFILIFAGRDIRHSEESLTWPETQGIVIESRVIEYTDESDYLYEPNIVYSYTVNSKTYTGSRRSYDERSDTNKKVIEDLLSDYPKGDPVTVYYKPENPEFSVLIRGEVRYKFALYLGWFLIGLGIVLGGVTIKIFRE